MIRRFTKVDTKWQGVDFIDVDDSNGDCWFIFNGNSIQQTNGLYLISTCEKFVKVGDWKEVPLEDITSMASIMEVPKGKIRYFKHGPKGTPWGSVDYVEYHYDTGDLWHVKNGKKENHKQQYSLKR